MFESASNVKRSVVLHVCYVSALLYPGVRARVVTPALWRV